MREIRTVTILVAKRDDIETAITNYDCGLEEVRADLSHINAVISIFEGRGRSGHDNSVTPISIAFFSGAS